MRSTDRQKFEEILKEFFAVLQTPFKQEITAWWFDALEVYELNAIREAMRAAVRVFDRRGGGVVPGMVLAHLPSRFGHPTPEQAWNHLPKSEHDGGYVTSLMMAALADCSDSLSRGDYIGGRKAFIESYSARVRAAETQKQAASFFYSQPSEGTREQRLQLKETKTIEALKNGWLTHEKAKSALSLICDELAKPLPLALERITGIVSGARIPGATTSLRIENKSSETSAEKLPLIEVYGGIREKLEEKRSQEAEKKSIAAKEMEERRRILLEQAEAILNKKKKAG